MNLNDILLKLQFVTNKSHSGRRLVPEYYNVLLADASNQKFFMEWRLLTIAAKEAGGIVLESLIEDTPLNRYKKDTTLSPPDANGKVNLPTDFHHAFGMFAKYESMVRKIDIVSEDEINMHLTSLAMPSLQYSPKAARYGTYIRVYPFNVGLDPNRIKLTYLSRPLVPYFDYCYRNAVAMPIYMPVGSYIKMGDDGITANLYNTTDDIIARNVSHPLFNNTSITGEEEMDDTPTDRGPIDPTGDTSRYTSRSVELDWNEEQHPAIVAIIMESLGVNLKDQQVKELGKEGQQQ